MSTFLSKHEDYDAQPEELTTPEDDWDVIVKSPVISAASLLLAHQAYDKGQVHPDYPYMFVADRRFRPLACGLNRYQGEVIYKGIADTARPARFFIRSYGERTTYDSVISPAFPSEAKPTDVSQPRLGITVKYISIGRPDTSVVGSNVIMSYPGGGPWDAPDNVFDYATDVILSFPYGWVLEKREGPNVPGTEIWLMEDECVYYFQWRLRG